MANQPSHSPPTTSTTRYARNTAIPCMPRSTNAGTISAAVTTMPIIARKKTLPAPRCSGLPLRASAATQ